MTLGLSAITWFLIFIAFFALLYWIIPQKYSWISYLVLTLLFAYLAYKVEPNPEDDITRYFHEMAFMRELGQKELDRLVEQNLFDFKNFRASMYYVYFISKFNDDYLLPAANIFIAYGLSFMSINKAIKRFNISKLNAFIGIMFFISTYWYYDEYSGTRNGISFTLAFACAYQLMVERRFMILSVIGLIISCLFHSAGIIPVALIVLTELTLNTSGKFINFLLIFGIIGGAIGIRFLDSVSDNSFVEGIAGKVDTYEAEFEFNKTPTTFKVNVVVTVLVLLLILYYSYFILNDSRAGEMRRFYKFASIVCYFCIGATFSPLIFVRFVRWIIPLIGCIIFMLGRECQKRFIDEKTLEYCLYYAPNSVSVRVKLQSIVLFLFNAFTAIHLWYLCNGSSLVWLHFDWEMIE